MITYSITLNIDQSMNYESKRLWYKEILDRKLCSRKKGEHLTIEHKVYICRLMRDFPENLSGIKSAFKLSKTTFSKLKKIKDSVFDEYQRTFEKESWSRYISIDAQKFIAETIRPPQFPLTIRRIQKAVYNEFGKAISPHIVKNFIKKSLKYSFKKGWSRPPR